MDLIQHNKGVLVQEVRVVGDFLQKDTVGHENDATVGVELCFLTDLVSYYALSVGELGLNC